MKMSTQCLINLSILVMAAELALFQPCFATTKGLSQIVTPELQPEGDLSLGFQAQSERIANPYELQAELGLTKWAEIAVFKGFKPNELIFASEIGLIQKEPYLLSVGFLNWSPHSMSIPSRLSKAAIPPSTRSSSPVRRMSGTATRPSSVMPTILTKPGAHRSILRADPETHRRLGLPVT
jgi:hypothetical protein